MSYALILSDGKPGHENQSKALAESLGLSFQILPCTFPCKCRKALSYLLDKVGIYCNLTGIRAPAEKPALLIGTGSNTFYTLKVLKRQLRVPCVALLTPKGYRFSDFDAVLAPAFDRPPELPNVHLLPTNLTPARPDFYVRQTAAFKERYCPQKKRAVGVIIGGKNPIADVTPEWLEGQLKAIFEATPECEHWVTTSRRTSSEAEAVVDAFPFDYKLLFSKDNFNPIPAFVTQCETLFVTAESTGMLSEAVAIGSADVEILDNLEPNAGKFGRFVNSLCEEGYAHRFDGTLGHASRKVDISPIIAQLNFAAQQRGTSEV